MYGGWLRVPGSASPCWPGSAGASPRTPQSRTGPRLGCPSGSPCCGPHGNRGHGAVAARSRRCGPRAADADRDHVCGTATAVKAPNQGHGEVTARSRHRTDPAAHPRAHVPLPTTTASGWSRQVPEQYKASMRGREIRCGWRRETSCSK